MKEEKLHIKDESRDKDFFTIVPNYILNHSTATDQALYLQLKRLAGDGKKNYCYPSFKYLSKQLHIGKKAIRKSLKYLIEHKWIDELGQKRIITSGGYQWVNAYRINNIWSLNFKYYKGGSERTPLGEEGGYERTPLGEEGGYERTPLGEEGGYERDPLSKGGSEEPKGGSEEPKGGSEEPKGGSVVAPKEEHTNNVSKNYKEIKQKFLKTCGKLFFRKKKKIENPIPQKKYKPLSDQESEAFLKKAKEEMIKLCFPNSKIHQ